MTLTSIIRQFVTAGEPPAMIDLSCVPLPADAELAARNERRIAECRERLGERWIMARPIVRRT